MASSTNPLEKAMNIVNEQRSEEAAQQLASVLSGNAPNNNQYGFGGWGRGGGGMGGGKGFAKGGGKGYGKGGGSFAANPRRPIDRRDGKGLLKNSQDTDRR